MIASEEIPRTQFEASTNSFFIHYEKLLKDSALLDEFSSKDVQVSKGELEYILSKYNYFKPK